jgi:hypothetical protein
MSQDSFFSYVHPSVLQVDLRTQPTEYQEYYKQVGTTIIHELVYRTDLPKRFELVNAHDSNPYHLLFYMLARFYFIDDGTSAISYYYGKEQTYLVEAALAALPPRFKRTTEREKTVEYVALPSCAYGVDHVKDTWVYLYIQNLYKHLLEESPRKTGTRIFISRHFASGRRLDMPPEFIQDLLNLGFSIYCLETMTFQDQIRLFHSAEVVCGPHGAGLSWTTFCEPGTLVCEIYPEGYEKGHFRHISEEVGLEYRQLPMCKLEGPRDTIQLDTVAFIEALKQILDKKMNLK